MSRPINVKNIWVSYSRIAVLRDVSLYVKKGELLAILGPSGCGKSTLLNVISGLQQAERGQIIIGEQRVDHLSPQQRGIGFLFQNYALFPTMTVWENIAFGLKIRRTGRKDIKKRVTEMMELVTLTDHAQKKPHQLSGGQKQRAALARALAPSPDVLLLDEPLSALDVKIRQHLRGEIKQLQKNLGITTILVTHDQEEAFELGDRVAVMEKGTIAQLDRPEIIYDSPATEFVACFVGNVNRLCGRVFGGRAWACGIPFEMPEELRNLTDGTSIIVLIRPENFIIDQVIPGQTVKNSLQGTVVNAVWLGPLVRLDIMQDSFHLVSALISKERAKAEGFSVGTRTCLRADLVRIIVDRDTPAVHKERVPNVSAEEYRIS